MTTLADRDLVIAAQEGDREALAELVRRYEGKVYSLALRMLGRPADAEDVLQETFLKVVRSLGGFRGESAFGTWIYRIATNEALMLLRKQGRESLGRDDDLDLDAYAPRLRMDWSNLPDTAALKDETVQKMSEAVAKLPESIRAVFLLRDVEQLSGAEVGDILGITVAAVKSRLHRARMQLRDELSEYFEDRTGS